MSIWVNQREYARPTPTAPVRGLASGLLAFHKRNCYSEHGSVELSNSSYVNTRPEPAQNHFMCCMAGVSGTGEAGRELWDVNEPNPGCLVQGCRSRTGPPGYPLTARKHTHYFMNSNSSKKTAFVQHNYLRMHGEWLYVVIIAHTTRLQAKSCC